MTAQEAPGTAEGDIRARLTLRQGSRGMKVSFVVPALAVLSGSIAAATPITYSASGTSAVSGMHLSASASFVVSGSNLVVTLTNASTDDVVMQADILTAVFFNVSGSPLGLGSGSAIVPASSSVLFGSTDPGNVVGGEYAYGEGISGALMSGTNNTVNMNYGLSGVGFGVFGQPTFPGNNLNGQTAIDGLNFGLTSAGDDPATGQGMVTGGVPLVKNSVVFTLTGLPAGFDPSTSITGAFFQYGTALTPTDPGFTGQSPAPAGALALGLGGLLASRRRR